jgi:hypothetical protein
VNGLRWIVRGGVGFRVRVVDESARPVPYARAALEWPSGDGSLVQMPFGVNADGIYVSSRSFPPGQYKLVAPGRSESSLLRLEDGQSIVDAELRLAGSGSLEVVATDDQDKNLDNLQVSARERGGSGPSIGGIALGAGKYRIGPLPSGSYVVSAHDGVNPVVSREQTISVASRSDSTLRVVLSRTGVLHGRVLDAGGSPIANAWVWTHASSVQPNPLLSWPKVLTDAAGEFEIPGLVNDALYDLTVAPPGGRESRQLAVSLLHNVELRVDAPAAGQTR